MCEACDKCVESVNWQRPLDASCLPQWTVARRQNTTDFLRLLVCQFGIHFVRLQNYKFSVQLMYVCILAMYKPTRRFHKPALALFGSSQPRSSWHVREVFFCPTARNSMQCLTLIVTAVSRQGHKSFAAQRRDGKMLIYVTDRVTRTSTDYPGDSVQV